MATDKILSKGQGDWHACFFSKDGNSNEERLHQEQEYNYTPCIFSFLQNHRRLDGYYVKAKTRATAIITYANSRLPRALEN